MGPTIKQKKNKSGRVVGAIRNRLIESALANDALMVHQAANEASLLGLEPVKLYSNVFVPALQALGDLYSSGKISIAEEHIATEIISSELTVLRAGFKPSRPNGFLAVLTTLPGDLHSLGLRIIADFLWLAGWQVNFLGTNTPIEELVRFVKERKPNLVAISVSNPTLLNDVVTLTSTLKALSPAPKLMLGGMAINSLNGEREQLGADSYASSAEEAIKEANRLVNLHNSKWLLEDFLKSIGKRIKDARIRKDMKQIELASGAKLNRAYLSAIESGKQNITLGVLLQISHTLEIPIEQLISREQ